MKKIIFYTDTPQIGGAENQIYLLASNLDREKFSPVLVCSSDENLDHWCEKFTKLEIPVYRLKAKHKHDPRHYSELKKILKAEQANLIHIHVWNPASCRYAFPAASSTKTPIIITEHDPFQLSKIKDLYKKFSLKKVKKIITVSKNNKKLLSKLYPEYKEKIQVIPNGVNISWWKAQIMGMQSEDHQKIKTGTFHANEDSLIISTVAELHHRKGLDILIRAIPKVVEKFANTKFVFVGDGPDKEEFIELVHKLRLENHVTFLGRRKNVARLLAVSNIFVLPSRREAFGLVNVEAMLCGLPIIASKVGGIPEIVEDGKSGLLVEAENIEALENAIIKLIQNPDLRSELAKNGYMRAHEHFDMKEMIERHQDLYLENCS